MLESIASYILLAFILGASFAFGVWAFAMVAAKFLPTPIMFGKSGGYLPSAMETAKQLQLKRIEIRGGKIFVLIFNVSTYTYTDFLFRITTRDEDGHLIEDLTCLAHGFARPQAEFDCVLSPRTRSEHWGLVDPNNSIKVELVHANTA